MSIDLSALQVAKSKLKNVVTQITQQDGSTVQERRKEDGTFAESKVCLSVDSHGDAHQEQWPTLITFALFLLGLIHCRKCKVELVRREFQRSTSEQSDVPPDDNDFPFSDNTQQRRGYVLSLKLDLQVANVCTGVYLSSQDVVDNLDLLKCNGITHIVNAATGIVNFFPEHFTYLNVNIIDWPYSDIHAYFDTVIDFMHNAINEGGHVLVHCNAGISRSSTLVIAYIMKHYSKRYDQAFEQVKSVRPVARPNVGFVRQLHCYECELFR